MLGNDGRKRSVLRRSAIAMALALTVFSWALVVAVPVAHAQTCAGTPYYSVTIYGVTYELYYTQGPDSLSICIERNGVLYTQYTIYF